MFGLNSQQRFFLCDQPADMRKGFDGLSGLVENYMGQKIYSGDAFIFLGKRLDRLKVLVWEPSGFILYYKRLESGTFKLLTGKSSSIYLSYSEFSLLLDGLEVAVTRRRKRYEKPLE
ncbi:IS66 family insertion sequence element accessory protein TnpB [Chondrinema litorale]|uniref:IS66 family insertion sequence element accessory protein TnpB n=1 Tax=Chondrinema litorale TaxID=2994555 RepID=UPI00254358B6|nr:IS66 family insertion sequence element accessory protein TnpB [Chondrinema litorale]UZS00043.1 IS66 family insertion sequence element accessory protein TnpB [Chondrinema litorale]